MSAMTHRSRAQWTLCIFALMAIGGLVPKMAAAEECADLPQSDLKFYQLSSDHVTEHIATTTEIARLAASSGQARPPHPLMAVVDAIDTNRYARAKEAGRLNEIPTNHNPHFAPVIHPTLQTGVETLIIAARAWLAP